MGIALNGLRGQNIPGNRVNGIPDLELPGQSLAIGCILAEILETPRPKIHRHRGGLSRPFSRFGTRVGEPLENVIYVGTAAT
jgi:hypothetical protein